MEKRIDAMLGKSQRKQILLPEFYDHDTVSVTCFVSKLFEIIYPTVAKAYGMRVGGTVGQEKDYDFLVGRKKIELKVTADTNMASFTSSSGQSKEGADGFYLMRYSWSTRTNKPNRLALWYTPALKDMPLTHAAMESSREKARVAGNTTFSHIRIPVEEQNLVTPIIGSKRIPRNTGAHRQSWLHQVMEDAGYNEV